MPKDTLGLTLRGDIPLAEFAEAMRHFSSLVEALTSEVGENAEIEWEISRLESGSATAVIVGKSFDQAAIEKVVRAFEVIGGSIQKDEAIPYSERVVKEARAITAILNGKITSVEFNTDDFGVSVDKPMEIQGVVAGEYAFGTVTGTVETLSKHGKMRFVLYDSLFNRAVDCFLQQGQEDWMLDAWDKRVRVAGEVTRDPNSGRPISVHNIQYIELIKSRGIDIGMLVGLIPWREGDELPEEAIRRLRDAE
jgi:hypothetical protein